MIKLFVVTQFFPPDYAPTGQLINELATHLAKQGASIRVFTGQPGYAFTDNSAPCRENSKGLFIKRTRVTQIWPQRIRGKLVNGLIFFLRAWLHLIKNCRQGDILLLTTAPPYQMILGWLHHLLFKVPYVCLVYDLYPDVAVELGVVSPKHGLVRLWNFINHLAWKDAKQIIVLSSTMKQRILSKYPEIASKILVIHNWGDPELIKPIEKCDNWFARRHKLVEKFTVLYSGNMGRCHDMETILQAAYHLQDEPIQFVMIGAGAKYQICIDRVNAWGLKNFLFLPYQDADVIPFSLTACDLSLVSIGSGMEGIVVPSKLYSSLASGRPLAAICEPHSYLRQIINAADCGATFDNGDWKGLSQFILQLASNPQLAMQMGQSGRSYMISNFTLEIIAKQYWFALDVNGYANSNAQNVSIPENVRQTLSDLNFERPIGQIFQQAGLLSSIQVSEILNDQNTQYHHLRFGELAVLKGWVPQETVDFFLDMIDVLKTQEGSTSLVC